MTHPAAQVGTLERPDQGVPREPGMNLDRRKPIDMTITRQIDITAGLSFQEMVNVAGTLVKTGFMPESVKTPEQALLIMMAGRELGIPTTLALRSINVIKGKVSLSSEMMLALFHARGGQSKQKVLTEQACTYWFKSPSGHEHEETYTLEDAKKEQLTGNTGWQRMPRRMMRWRSISAGLKVVAPEIVSGLYDPTELGGSYNDQGEVVLPENSQGKAEQYISESQRRQLFGVASRKDLRQPGHGEEEKVDAHLELKKIIAFVQDLPLDQASTKKVTEADFAIVLDMLNQFPDLPNATPSTPPPSGPAPAAVAGSAQEQKPAKQ